MQALEGERKDRCGRQKGMDGDAAAVGERNLVEGVWLLSSCGKMGQWLMIAAC